MERADEENRIGGDGCEKTEGEIEIFTAADAETVAQNIAERMKRRRALLFHPDDACFSSLGRCLAETHDRRAVVSWAFSLATEGVAALQANGCTEGADEAANALSSARLWAAGAIGMPAARQSILSCHACAKRQADPCASSYLHAVAQACSVVHSVKHALGYPVYELTALAVKSLSLSSREVPRDILFCARALCARIEAHERTLRRIRRGPFPGAWAPFLTRPRT